jgi:type IV pilus assembly protein PilB
MVDSPATSVGTSSASASASSFEKFLVDGRYITKDLYDMVYVKSQSTGKPVVSLIETDQVMTSEGLAQAKAAFLKLPYVTFTDQVIKDSVLGLVARDTELFYRFMPFEQQGTYLKVAIVDPFSIQAIEALEFYSKKLGYTVQLFVTDGKSFDHVMNQGTKVVGEALKDIEQRTREDLAQKQRGEHTGAKAESLQQMVQEAPISKIVDVIMTNAIDSGASDIHIEPTDKDLRIRYRLDGILHETLSLPRSVMGAIVSKVKILSNLKIDESRLPQDGRFHYDTSMKSVDLRVSILPNINGEKIVMRILNKSTKPPTLGELGYRGQALVWINEDLKKSHGIMLITGPTGSGKSTTLFAVLSMLNNETVNIVTLEDPVEYYVDGANQTQTNADIGLTFASGLRSILRQDPNIIMVGEVRDRETAELAVNAALTGHLVFSTLHTNNAIGALPRLIDMGIEPFLLVASINSVAAQRLCRTICPDCKYQLAEADVLAATRASLVKDMAGVSENELEGLDPATARFYAGKGCSACGHTGYRGRMSIVELLPLTQKIQEMVLAKGTSASVFAEAQKIGMITMKQDGIIKAMQGKITYDEVLRVTSE